MMGGDLAVMGPLTRSPLGTCSTAGPLRLSLRPRPCSPGRRSHPGRRAGGPCPGQPQSASDALISEMRERISSLERQLEAERQANSEHRRLLAAALERIPPALEAPESPEEGHSTRGGRGGSVAGRQKDGALGEALLDKYFDFFKHIGTLDVAVAIVMLAISRSEQYVPWVYISLVALGVSLCATLSGMKNVLGAHTAPGQDPNRRARLRRLALLCSAALIGGIGGGIGGELATTNFGEFLFHALR